MNCNRKRIAAVFLLLVFLLALNGCSATEQDAETGEQASSWESASVKTAGISTEDMFSQRDKESGYDESAAVAVVLNGDQIACDSDQVEITGSTAVIKDAGTYLLSGILTNGQIVVEAEKTDKLQLVLNGVQANCDTSAVIYVKQADKVWVTLADGTENTLSNKNEFVAIDDNNIDSVIFSKEDLTLNGTGKLTIEAVYGHGIVSKDDLALTGGSYEITAASHALSGKDSIRIADGSFVLASGKDGLHAENTDDTSLGFIYIEEGEFHIISEGDGMDASAFLQIEGGSIDIQSGGGSENAAVQQEELFGAGGFGQQASTDTETETASTKGLKASETLTISGGTITVDSADDAMHSNADILIQGGVCTVATGDDGIHADAGVTIDNAEITVTESYEGIEGLTIDITGGTVSVIASDDGINAAGGNDQSGFDGGMMQDRFASDSDSYIRISGGTVTINASGDGIDSNGNLYVSGGETYISGPTNSGNGALDYAGEAQVTGGVFIAAGESGMAQNFSSSSTQGAILVHVTGSASDGEVVLKDSNGNTLVSYTPQKSYGCILVSCPQIEQGKTYLLTAAGQSISIDMESLIYGSGGNVGGQPGGGNRPNGQMQPPGGF